MTIGESLAPHLSYLRRYARALTGSQASGDAFVRAALTALLAQKSELAADLPPRVALYRLFHLIWAGTAGQLDPDLSPELRHLSPEERLQSLSSAERAALLLTAVEGFSLTEAAAILGLSAEEVEQSVAHAQHAIEKSLATSVLIIEDEAVIALDIENLVLELGHTVAGIAATQDEAVSFARARHPGLVLADVNLGEGGSGLEAVADILKNFRVPVIFVTAYPERLLTGERPEPTYLVTKPFVRESLQATIGQVLFFASVRREAA